MKKMSFYTRILFLFSTPALLFPGTVKGATSPLDGCPGGNSIFTAIGCIPVLESREAFLTFILKWATGIGAGIAFLLIIYGGFMVMTSSGIPEKIRAGQEILTSAVSGLILLILSVFILKIIGVDILGIPGF